ncbi:MAG: hypothetical protein Q7K03_10315 [Dehalococcoidia bacterium]|nr:hypothetical protein [Dehalococcoidia bacterium]
MASHEQLIGQAGKLPPGVPLQQQVASYRGNPHRALLELLKDPDGSINSILAGLGIAIGTYYSWRGNLPFYAATVDTIREQKESLRRAAALAILEARTVPIAEAMAERAVGTGRDAQRAGERILETVGVLPKGGEQLQPAPIQVVTHTYVLVQPQPGSQGVVVEATPMESAAQHVKGVLP